MSIRLTSEAAGPDARTAGTGEETTPVTADRGTTPRGGRLQPGNDFNPLMERVMRAQQLAEGRLYRVS